MPFAAAALIAGFAGLATTSPLASKPGRNPVPPARETGPAESCVPLTQLRDSHIRDDRTIDFMRDRTRGWRVTLPQDCPGLKSANAFSYQTSLSQLCSVDVIHVLYQFGSGFQRGASCGLGKFQPIELAK
ncbi:hypothetical protein C0V78_13080 [Novosphingobium sp. TH158]|nr:hypothetical protein C0V78_13080 [Novosphingobium sp. TH158]